MNSLYSHHADYIINYEIKHAKYKSQTLVLYRTLYTPTDAMKLLGLYILITSQAIRHHNGLYRITLKQCEKGYILVLIKHKPNKDLKGQDIYVKSTGQVYRYEQGYKSKYSFFNEIKIDHSNIKYDPIIENLLHRTVSTSSLIYHMDEDDEDDDLLYLKKFLSGNIMTTLDKTISDKLKVIIETNADYKKQIQRLQADLFDLSQKHKACETLAAKVADLETKLNQSLKQISALEDELDFKDGIIEEQKAMLSVIDAEISICKDTICDASLITDSLKSCDSIRADIDHGTEVMFNSKLKEWSKEKKAYVCPHDGIYKIVIKHERPDLFQIRILDKGVYIKVNQKFEGPLHESAEISIIYLGREDLTQSFYVDIIH